MIKNKLRDCERKKQLNRISMLKDSEIDSNDTDSDNEDNIEEFEERGENYFKHCIKEKKETFGTWCKHLK
jgi:hypothetical protein